MNLVFGGNIKMKYELAKKLKDAGFPQNKDILSVVVEDNTRYTRSLGQYLEIDGEEFYFPTLSELIEACGKSFWGIIQAEWIQRLAKEEFEKAGIDPKGLKKPLWRACDQLRVIEGLGDTPEEAVANLWLELNKK